MAFRLRTHESAGKGLKRIFRKELRSAIEQLQATRVSDAAIHEARKSIKKVRSLVRLLAKDVDIGAALEHLRDAAHMLAPIRDAEALVGSARTMCSQHRDELPPNACQSLIAQFADDKTHVRRAASRKHAMLKAIHLLRRVDGAAKEWKWNNTGVSKLVSKIRRMYKKASRSMRHLSLRSRPENVHEWRKRTKDLWYALRLFEKRGAHRRDLTNLERLETWLGEDHNLATLRVAMTNRGGSARPVLDSVGKVALRDQWRLRKKALSLGRRTFLQTPSGFEKRLRAVLR